MTARVILPAGASREEWLAARRDGIGGSEIGALLGASPFATPADVWAAKVHGDQAEENDAMRVGTALESGVLTLGLANLHDAYGGRWWAEDDLPALLAHPDHDVIRYSPDGIAHGERESVLLEAKVTSSRLDEPRPSWVAQVQWGLLVTGLPWAQISAVCGSQASHWRIDPDPQWQQQALEYALGWWSDHVVTGTPPPPTTLTDVARWWNPEKGAVHQVWRDDADELRQLHADHERVQAEAKQVKADLDAAMVRVMAAAGNASALDLGAGTVVKLSRVVPSRFDSRTFATTHPRLTKRFTHPGTPQLRATWPRKKDDQ